MDEVREEVTEEPIVNIPIYDVGDGVELLSGEFSGSTGKIGARQIVDGGWQYGVEGIVGSDMYAVHEHEIQKSTVVPKAVHTSYGKTIKEEDDVSSLLQKASQISQGRELDTNQALQGILERLDVLDKRLEVKEIKVVVEVHHMWDDEDEDVEPVAYLRKEPDGRYVRIPHISTVPEEKEKVSDEYAWDTLKDGSLGTSHKLTVESGRDKTEDHQQVYTTSKEQIKAGILAYGQEVNITDEDQLSLFEEEE